MQIYYFCILLPESIGTFLPENSKTNPNTMKKFVIAILALTAALASSAQQWKQSRVVTDTVHSEILGAERACTIYLPPGFDEDSTRTYPVLYLLHGMHGDNNSWFRDQRARDVLDRNIFSGEAVEMVVVSPNAGGGDPAVYQNGYFNMPGWAYEDFFFNELMPYVEKRYRAGGSKKMRAVAGLSMGGGGTTGYAQHHPDKFCAAYAMSALMDIPKYGAVPSKSPDDKIARLTKSVQDNSCVRHVAEADDTQREALRSVQWFVDCGDDDFLLDRNIDFVQAMHRAGIPLQFRVREGGHDSEYWHSALHICLPFVSRAFTR